METSYVHFKNNDPPDTNLTTSPSDLIIVTNNQEIREAHKIILSACSLLFRKILKQNKHQHPLIYLKDIKYSELLSLLNFMYLGEVNVAQEDLR